MSQLEKALNKVENINLCRKLAWDFFGRINTVSFDELLAESIYAYYEALEKFNPEKGVKPITFLYTCMYNHLSDYCKALEREQPFDELPEYNQPCYTPETEFIRKERITSLLAKFTGSTREVVTMVLEEQVDLNTAPKMVRGNIIRELINRGYKVGQAWGLLKEVTCIVKANRALEV